MRETFLKFRILGRNSTTVIDCDGELLLIVYLIIGGMFYWRADGAKTGGKTELASFDFEDGKWFCTVVTSTMRALMYLVSGCEIVYEHRRVAAGR